MNAANVDPTVSLKCVLGTDPQPGHRTRPPTLGPQRRILIVDDNLDAAESLNRLLGLERHETRVVLGGRAALATISRGFQPDFVLLDLGLPDLNGFEVAQSIRATQPHSSIKIIALTGWGQAEDRMRSLEAGFDAHLLKPVDYEALTQILAADIERR